MSSFEVRGGEQLWPEEQLHLPRPEGTFPQPGQLKKSAFTLMLAGFSPSGDHHKQLMTSRLMHSAGWFMKIKEMRTDNGCPYFYKGKVITVPLFKASTTISSKHRVNNNLPTAYWLITL